MGERVINRSVSFGGHFPAEKKKNNRYTRAFSKTLPEVEGKNRIELDTKTLIVITWNAGVVFHDYIRVIDKDNIENFFEPYNIFNFFTCGSMITIVVIEDILLEDIPLVY